MRTLICLTLLLGFVASVDAAGTTGTVNGTVVNSDGKTLANQKVRIKKVFNKAPIGKSTIQPLAAEGVPVATVTTDKDGKFTQALEPGEYWAEAGSKSQGYAKERFTIKTGETTDVKLTLTKDEPKG